jgi:hypothetical protein
MMMSADTGVLDAARREAAAITAELQAQEGQLRRNLDLEARLQQQAQGRRGGGGYAVDELGLSLSVQQSAASASAGSSSQFQSRFGVSEELAFQRRFDEALDRSIRRKTTQGLATGGGSFRSNMGNVRDVSDLIHGQWSLRNVHGATELGATAFQGTRFGTALGTIAPALGSLAMLSAAITPVIQEIWATFSGSTVNKAVKDWNAAVSRTGKISSLSLDTRERSLGAIRMGIAGEGDTLEERMASGARKSAEIFQRRMAMVGHAGITAALLSGMRFDKQIQGLNRYVGATSSGVEDIFKTLEQNKMPVTTIIKNLEKEISTVSDRQQKQQEWFGLHPQEAAQYHERLRNDKRIERSRYEQQQREWNEM